MHAQGVNVSSEMIKEMGIKILDRVNEVVPDEKNIHYDFFSRVAFQGGDFAAESRRYHKMYVGHVATSRSMI